MHRWTHALVAVALLGLSGCGGGGGDGGETIADVGGSLKVYVTDAPFPSSYVASATIVIREVRARNQEADGWQVLFEGEAEMDLVPLTGGVASLLADIDVPAGQYDEVRLIVDAGAVVLTEDAFVQGEERTFDTETGGLHFPSGSQTGIKVKIDEPIVVTTGLSGDLTLDFDLQQNFVFNGSPDHAPGVKRVIFTPVVRAVNATTAGTITLVVLTTAGTDDDTTDDGPAVDAKVIVKEPTGEEVAPAIPAADGTASIAVPPGVYDVEIQAFGHDTAIVPGVEVVLGNVTDLGTIRLLVSPAEIYGVVYSENGTSSDTTDDTVLGGATVSLVPSSDPTATPTTVTADTSGVYRFESVLPDTYDLTFSATGHADLATNGVVVAAGESKAVDATLASTP